MTVSTIVDCHDDRVSNAALFYSDARIDTQTGMETQIVPKEERLRLVHFTHAVTKQPMHAILHIDARDTAIIKIINHATIEEAVALYCAVLEDFALTP